MRKSATYFQRSVVQSHLLPQTVASISIVEERRQWLSNRLCRTKFGSVQTAPGIWTAFWLEWGDCL